MSLAFAGNALCNSYSEHRNAVVIAKEELESKMAGYTFQLKRLQDLLDEEGGTPSALQLLMEKEHDIMKVVRDMSQIKTSHQLALATSIQAVTAGEDIRVKERQLELGREQLGISHEMLGLKHAKSSAMNTFVDKLTDQVHESSQHQTTSIEKIAEQMIQQSSSLQETIRSFSSDSIKSQQQQRSELLVLFKELQQSSITVQEGQTNSVVSVIDKLIHQLVTSKEDHKEDLGTLVNALVGSKSQDKESITELIHQLSENGQRNTEDLRAAIAHTERFCMSTEVNGVAESIDSLQKQVGQVVELLGSKEFKTVKSEFDVPTKPVILNSELSEEEIMSELQDRFRLLVKYDEERERPQLLDAATAPQSMDVDATATASSLGEFDFGNGDEIPEQVTPSPLKDYDVDVSDDELEEQLRETPIEKEQENPLEQATDVQFVGNEVKPIGSDVDSDENSDVESDDQSETEPTLDEAETGKSVSFDNPISADAFPTPPNAPINSAAFAEAPQEVRQEAPQEVRQEVPQEVRQEVPQEVRQEVPPSFPAPALAEALTPSFPTPPNAPIFPVAPTSTPNVQSSVPNPQSSAQGVPASMGGRTKKYRHY